jgi:hypothetical protein
MGKHNNLFVLSISDKEKRFQTLTAGANVTKLFFFIADEETN